MSDEIIEGTCPDMCPVSERKFRIKNNLMSYFELLSGKPNESKMIKEYTRSAADQKIKKAELRTSEALAKTMDYIVSNIVDKFDKTSSKSVQMWYDFIWDRTRAIRKDITVQRLIGSNVIQIVERCARFHILCSYILCEQPVDVFDFKMNEKNLVNCIQTLRELYQLSTYSSNSSNNSSNDQTDDGQSMIYRSEFICYYILQNLDKENLIEEISLIDKEIRETDDLRFAIRIFIAYKSLNYYTFIRLLLRSKLLQACILNRYLDKMRFQAFKLIRKATVVGQQKIYIPDQYFMKQLCLKENELKKFCSQINCDLETNRLVFIKTKELNLDINFKLHRNSLIDKKLEHLKLSDIINATVQTNQTPVDELLDQFNKIDFFNSP